MKSKKILALALASLMCLTVACSSNTASDTNGNGDADTTAESVVEGYLYSLENMSASEIMDEIAKYYTVYVPTEGQNIEEFIGSLPVAPESHGNMVSGYASYANYFSDGVFPDRVKQISWLNYNMEGDTCTNIGTTDNDGNQVDVSNVIFVIHDESLALELVDLYREAIQSDSEAHGAVCHDNSHDDIWEILWSRAGKVQFKFTMNVNSNVADGGYEIHVWHYQE